MSWTLSLRPIPASLFAFNAILGEHPFPGVFGEQDTPAQTNRRDRPIPNLGVERVLGYFPLIANQELWDRFPIGHPYYLPEQAGLDTAQPGI